MPGERVHVYELGDPLDRGGPGQVYRASVVETGGPLAPGAAVQVRLLSADDTGGDQVLDELVETHGLARNVDFGAVASPLDFGITTGSAGRRFWSVTPWVPGRTLADLLDGVAALPDALTEALASAVAVALEALHRGGIRAIGLTPRTILMRDDSSILLLDPGLGPAVEHESWTTRNEALRACVAPELAVEPPQRSAQADLYALGAVLYRCIAGAWLATDTLDEDDSTTAANVGSRRPNDVRHEASIFLSEVVHELLDPVPDGRFATSTQLLEVLEERRKSEWWQSRHIEQDTVGGSSEHASLVIEREPEPPPIPAPAPPPEANWIERRIARRGSLAEHVAPCVAHDDELNALVHTVAELWESRGEVLLIEGEAGVGKTRLMDELLVRLEAVPDAVVLFGEHRRLGIGRPLQAFSEAITRWIGGTREVSEAEVRPLLGEATGIGAAFAAFLSSEPLPDGVERLTRESLASAFSHALKTLCGARPVVFIVENLQWADPEGLDLFGFLGRLCGSLPLLLIGSYRPPNEASSLAALLATLKSLPHSATSRMLHLDAVETVELVSTLVEPADLAGALGSRLHVASGGLPGQVLSTLGVLEAEGRLVRGDNGLLHGEPGCAGAALPSTAEEAVTRRVDLLSETERRLLGLAAVQGVAFDAGVVLLAAGLHEDDVRPAFARLSAWGFLWGSWPAFRFSGNEVFALVHEELDDTTVERLHEATADAFLASRNPDQLPPSELHGILSYRVAWHYLLAGRSARGMLYVPSALQHLRDTWRIGDAERLADRMVRALEDGGGRVGELIDTLMERAELLGVQGRRIEQREVVDQALLDARTSGDEVRESRVLLASAALRLVTGRVKHARAEARESLRLADHAGEMRLEARAQHMLGRVAFRESRFQEARGHMKRVLEISRRVRDADAEAEALETLGNISQDVGSFDHAEELQRAAMRIYRRSGDLAREADVLSRLGTIAASSGDPVKGEQFLRRAIAIHRSLGDGYGEARTLALLGTLMHESGRLSEARVLHRACLRISRELGARSDELVALVNLATAEYVLGRLDDSRDHFGDALRAGREVGDVRLEGYALAGLADIARQRAEHRVSASLYKRARRRLKKVDDVSGLASVLLGAARLQVVAGKDREATSRLDQALKLARNPRAPGVLAIAEAYLGLLAARHDRMDEAAARLKSASEHLRGASGLALESAEVSFVASLVERVARQEPAAASLLLEAEAALHEIGQGLTEEDRSTFLTEVSPAREIVAGAAAIRASRMTPAAREGDTA